MPRLSPQKPQPDHFDGHEDRSEPQAGPSKHGDALHMDVMEAVGKDVSVVGDEQEEIYDHEEAAPTEPVAVGFEYGELLSRGLACKTIDYGPPPPHDPQQPVDRKARRAWERGVAMVANELAIWEKVKNPFLVPLEEAIRESESKIHFVMPHATEESQVTSLLKALLAQLPRDRLTMKEAHELPPFGVIRFECNVALEGSLAPRDGDNVASLSECSMFSISVDASPIEPMEKALVPANLSERIVSEMLVLEGGPSSDVPEIFEALNPPLAVVPTPGKREYEVSTSDEAQGAKRWKDQ
ncbi:hypothetical protein FRB93_005637 [Tulasnella sp. JGI-2019a]|nr:hypothetical protein FRB93_005637 [Tulasnella sp. JGI-2019a]